MWPCSWFYGRLSKPKTINILGRHKWVIMYLISIGIFILLQILQHEYWQFLTKIISQNTIFDDRVYFGMDSSWRALRKTWLHAVKGRSRTSSQDLTNLKYVPEKFMYEKVVENCILFLKVVESTQPEVGCKSYDHFTKMLQCRTALAVYALNHQWPWAF